ncbi:hypothetical protein EJ05DRAFT_497022 [Pseudovirgaria hyperparasitica]|uniref:Uncharacterized protein n=1 Tax=Pseudovirgaria hyperparasitica TaxID=470096 RepID=A0A6A6WJ02_9PEZI|nr:uncharacterized protein EJ05DRAFT_497022 [Pseudovirgaria hyperparasitica]KAF2762155.1 hypothetical protein EJ05DRAFT_497022 [Pseudovirgaria hyperparasitica]
MIPYKPIINSPFASRFPLVITLLCIILSIYEIVTSKVHGKNWMEKTQTDKKEQKHVVVLLLAALRYVLYDLASICSTVPSYNRDIEISSRFIFLAQKLMIPNSLVSLITSITARYHRAAWMAENPDWNKRSPDWTRFAYVPNKARWWQVWSALKESIRGPKPAPLLPTTEVRVAVVDESTEKEKDCWDAIREDAGQRLEEEG